MAKSQHDTFEDHAQVDGHAHDHTDHDPHGHDDHAIHQAPWVTVLTLAICFGVVGFILFIKSL